MKLVIVESPAKAKTIEGYLKEKGNYKVVSSIGHIRDLPKSSKNAVDIEAGFVPQYVISAGKKSVIASLTKFAEKSDEILLATDQDREGEAISWHLAEVLKGQTKAPLRRITFNEITKEAVLEAIEHPREIDQDLRRAQEARRVLDRLVGYDLSGLIWKKVRYGLSAGRVQSPALRIIMEREREIRAFIPETFWVITGTFTSKGTQLLLTCEKEPRDRKEVDRILEIARSGTWNVTSVTESEVKRNPKAPFTTSTLQQTASSRLGFSPSRTMRVAQGLYESGKITYMRTDSTQLSGSVLGQIKEYVTKTFGAGYLETRVYSKKSKNAQEAHEAIRPTRIASVVRSPKNDADRLYDLIWRRTVASQMASAKLMRTKIIANVTNGDIPNFATTGARVMYPGWFAVDPASKSEDVLIPEVPSGSDLALVDVVDETKETQPPSRYTEAGLIKELEKRGIGRPSTYASIMKTLNDRGYTEKQGRTLFPTDTGDVVSSFLEIYFASYISDSFTAGMEDELDEIARGERDYETTLRNFYGPFQAAIIEKEDIPKITNLGPADAMHVCPDCGASMVIKLGKVGKFLSCEKFPDCTGALTLEGKKIGEQAPLGVHPELKEEVYVLDGRFGPYVQLGKKTDENPSPRRASLPKGMTSSSVDMDTAVRLLVLPRELGAHPESGDMVLANIGRFGPYVGHGREFRSLKKGDDPYTISFDRALEILKEEKKLPRGVELAKNLGKHPKTGKEILVLKSKSGLFLRKGLKRIYLPDDTNIEEFTLEQAVQSMSQ